MCYLRLIFAHIDDICLCLTITISVIRIIILCHVCRICTGENIIYKHLVCNKRNCAFTCNHFFSRNHDSRLICKQLQSTMPVRIVRSDYDDPSTTVSSFSFDLWVTDNRIRSSPLPFLSTTMSVLCCALFTRLPVR